MAVYILWNICSYAMKFQGVSVKTYDYIYWTFERVFVLVTFLMLISYVQKNYKWVIRAMILVASFKLVYILLVITNIIVANTFWSLMGVLFMIVLGYVTIRWEKQQK